MVTNNRPYQAIVREWLDGDTVKLSIQFGLFGITADCNVRLFGIDTPEMHSANPAEKLAATKARDFAACKAPAGSIVTVEVKGNDKYGRCLASILDPDGEDLAKQQIAAGNARPYFGDKKVPWPWGPPTCQAKDDWEYVWDQPTI